MYINKKLFYLSWLPLALLVWLFIFGIYEIIERTFLTSISSSTLHILHIIRGTGTSFILAGLVAWYLIRHGKIIEEKASIPSKLFDDYEYKTNLHNKMKWLVKLRWIAISGVVLSLLITRFIPVISKFSVIALSIIAFSMCIYNTGFHILLKRIQTTKAVAFSQVFLDLIALTLLLHFSGGIENPFFAFFVFHVIIASILLEKNESYIIASITCILFSSMVILEHIGILEHYPLGLMGSSKLFYEWYYIIGILIAFISTTMFSTYFATTIMETLREKQRQLVKEIARIKEMQAQLVQAGKMVAVGQLASSIAHEINNPLATISASSELLQEFAKENTIKKYLKRIEDNVYRCKEIITSLLGFARREDMGFNESNVNEILDETLKLVRESAKTSSKEIIKEYDGSIMPVHANFRQLQQVFLNLIINALDAIEANGKVHIKTFQNNGYIIAEISDNGKGIPIEQLHRIFEPFFTTKTVGKGTGLGLYLAHQIINSISGKIEVESEHGKGSAFSVYIPASQYKK